LALEHVFFKAVERAVVFSPAKRGDKPWSIFLSLNLLQKKVVVLFLARRDGKKWSNYSFPPLLHKNTVVFLVSKRGDGVVSTFFGSCSVQSKEKIAHYLK
jgi:hypothetical protein